MITIVFMEIFWSLPLEKGIVKGKEPPADGGMGESWNAGIPGEDPGTAPSSRVSTPPFSPFFSRIPAGEMSSSFRS
jgi:hypothetical protein